MLSQSCGFRPGTITPTSVPPSPDYSLSSSWAALPSKADDADRVPDGAFEDKQQSAQVDVFFIHPTTYLGKGKKWNASIQDAKLNEKTDQTTILYQASIFNGAGRVYAPRYRQAHLKSFYTKDKKSADQALDLAYQDVKNAFQYYLDHYNQKRPIIIASHSQGALHAKKLLSEFFDGKKLKNRLVVAYVVGWPVMKEEFKAIPVCSTPNQTGCICSWRTFKHGFLPEKYPTGDGILITNPLSWQTDERPVSKEENEGAVLKKLKVYPHLVDAEIHSGVLWAHKPKFPGSFLFNRKNYHVADFNFYYANVRENAIRRVGAFWK